MAVRFLPPPEERSPHDAEDRSDLAEVVEMRVLLQRRTNEGAEDADAREADTADSDGGDTDSMPRGHSAEIVELPSARVAGELAEGEFAECVGADGELEGDGAERDEPDPETPARSTYEDGVRVLARRARSSGELRDDLLRLDHDAYEVEAVIAEFENSHYLDDLGLARAVTEKLRSAKRASRAQIRIKLRERKLPDGAIEEALGELDNDEEFELLRDTARDRARKLGGLDRQTAERRLLGFLARRGWSGEPAMRAAREALDGVARGSGGVRFR